MDIKLVKINKQVVTPIKTTKLPPDMIKGYDLFPEIYGNIFLCATKKSGKTSVVFKIIKSCCDKDTTLYIFCSTHNKDENWKEIKQWLDDREMNVHFFNSLIEDKVNMLELILSDMNESESEHEEEEEEEEEEKICSFQEDNKCIAVKLKKKKPKKIAPKVMFIFDDFSGELKDANVSELVKHNRHYKSKVIISSQYPNDLIPGARFQIDYWILFKGHSEEKLAEIFSYMNLPIKLEEFKNLYYDATKEKYNFFYVDKNNVDFRKNFNSRYVLN